VASAEWKQELARSQLEEHYLDSSRMRGFLDVEHDKLAEIMPKISLAGPGPEAR
jgi:hypothetical protein